MRAVDDLSNCGAWCSSSSTALAKAFSRFYDRKLGVRVIDAEPEALRTSRLRLCDLTARVLRVGLGLLGIETVEKM